MAGSNEHVSETDANVHHRSIFEDPEDGPATELVTIIADLKGVDQADRDSLYARADDLIGDLCSSPPIASAQAVVEFTYEGYRITLYQDGHAVLMEWSTSE